MELADFLRAVFALALTLGLVGLAAVALRRFGPDAVARLAKAKADRRLKVVETLVLDPARRLVLVRGQPVKLTPTEYALLRLLVQHAGRVLTHRQILRAVWGPEYVDETHYLRVYFAQLRQKLEADPARPTLILTEPGVGYRLAVPADG